MQATPDLLKEPVPQALSTPIARPKAARLAYLDTLRVVLISLVIRCMLRSQRPTWFIVAMHPEFSIGLIRFGGWLLGFYLHPVVLIPLAVAMSPLPVPPLLKFAIVLPLTVAITFLLTDAYPAHTGCQGNPVI